MKTNCFPTFPAACLCLACCLATLLNRESAGATSEHTPPAGTPAPRITGIHPAGLGRVRVDFESDPAGYFILLHGTTVRDIRQPARLQLGMAGTASFEVTVEVGIPGFLRLGRQPVASPLDTDRDGIDDVYELGHPRCLDPLDAADAARDFDRDGRTNLDEYRDGTDPEDGVWTGETLYVVDVPDPGNRAQFGTLAEALAHVRSFMPASGNARILLATATPQDVDGLNLNGGIDLDVAEGYGGRAVLRGPGARPFEILTTDGFVLNGIGIENAGGLRIAAPGRVQLRNSRLPGTTLTLAAAGSSRARLNGGAGSTLSVGDCQVAGALRLEWFGSAGSEARLAVTDTRATVIEAAVRSTFGGSARIQGSVAEAIRLSFDALAAGTVELTDLTQVNQLDLAAQTTGNPTLTLGQILAGAVNVEFQGLGSVFASFEEITATTLNLDLGAAESETTLSRLTLDDLDVGVGAGSGGPPRVRHRQQDVKVKGGIRIDAWDAERGQLDLVLAVVNASTLELRTRASTKLRLGDGVTLTGRLNATVESEVLTLDTLQARLEAGLEVQATGLSAGVSGFWQGGLVRGSADIQCAQGVWVGLTIDGTAFDPGGVFRLHEEAGPSLRGGGSGTETVPRVLHGFSAQGTAIVAIRNLAQAPGELLIAGIDSGVTLQGCSFQATGLTPAVVLEDVGGPIRVEDCRFAGQGLGISDAGGEVVLSGNRVELSSALTAGLGIEAASALLEDTTVTGDGVMGLALSVRGTSVVRRMTLDGELGLIIDSGDTTLEDGHVGGFTQITGGRVQARRMTFDNLIMVAGQGRLGFSECALANVQIVDLNENGGLLDDPTEQGALPDLVYSSIDFDGDDLHCADYPPPQHREDTGECVRPGVARPQ